MSGVPHDPEIADWMGLDADVEALLLAAEESQRPLPAAG